MRDDYITTQEIASGLGAKPDGNGKWKALCPCHDDHKPSLQITEFPDGKTGVKCWAGCSGADIIRELESRDLWGRRRTSFVSRFEIKGGGTTVPKEEASQSSGNFVNSTTTKEIAKDNKISTIDISNFDMAMELLRGRQTMTEDDFESICPSCGDLDGEARSLSVARYSSGNVGKTCKNGCSENDVDEAIKKLFVSHNSSNDKEMKEVLNFKDEPPANILSGEAYQNKWISSKRKEIIEHKLMNFPSGKNEPTFGKLGFTLKRIYAYLNKNNKFSHCQVRLENPGDVKEMRPVHFDDESGSPIVKMPGVYKDYYSAKTKKLTRKGREKPIFRRDEVLANPDATIFICEGEKAADSLANFGILATTFGSAAGVKRSEMEIFRGRTIILWPDNDDVGKESMNELGQILLKKGCTVFLIEIDKIDSLKPKDDSFDFIKKYSKGTEANVIRADIWKLPKVKIEKVRGKTKKSEKEFQPDTGGLFDGDLTERANVFRVLNRHGNDMKFIPGKGWHIFDGKCWKPDVAGEVFNLVKKTSDHYYQLAKTHAEDLIFSSKSKERTWSKKVMNHFEKFQSITEMKKVLEQISTEKNIVVPPEKMDEDINILNCQNGIIDVETGEFHDHDRDYLVTKISNAVYDPEAVCPRIEKFIEEIMDGNFEKIGYLQQFLGICLTGSIREPYFHIFDGGGANGKTVLIELFSSLMGEYSSVTSTRTLLKEKHFQPRYDLADLQGVRFTHISELPRDGNLNDELLKALTGGDTITSRQIYEKTTRFINRAKIVFTTNFLPSVAAFDGGIRRRARRINFGVTIPVEKQNLKLLEELKSELSGFLNWCLMGYRKYLKVGRIVSPMAIKSETEEWLGANDPVGRFISEACVTGDDLKCSKGALHKSYFSWCLAEGILPLSEKNFYYQLRSRGYKDARKWFYGSDLRRKQRRAFIGIDLAEKSGELVNNSINP